MSANHPQELLPIPSRQWQPSTILNDTVLEPVYELNNMFLTVLAAAPRLWGAGADRWRLPDPILLRLVGLDSAGRSAVSRCPFSLFGARFHDDQWWMAAAQHAAVHEPAPEAADVDPAHASFKAFSQLALFYAWHLAHSHPRAARVVLGMSDRTLLTFHELPLLRLQRLAVEHPELLTPRWRDRPSFWHSLLGQADAKGIGAEGVRLLGVQLLAAELAVLQQEDCSARRGCKP